MFDYVISVEIGNNFNDYVIRAESEREAKTKLWNSMDDMLKNVVANMEVVDVQEVRK